MDDKESLVERRDNELEVLQAIYMDGFQDIREKPEDLPRIVLQLTPLQSMREKGVHAKVELVVQYTPNYPNQSPIISFQNAVGISKTDLQELQTQLKCKAADLVGEVMTHHLAYLVQSFLHSHNKPRLSFYDEMMTNKKKEEEREKAEQLQKLQEQQEANKLISDEEARQIEEELTRREEMMKENRKKRSSLLGNRDKEDISSQSQKNRDVEMSPSKDTSGILKRLTNQASGKADGLNSAMSLWRRRRNSSESSVENHAYTGSRSVTFGNKGEHTIHCGKCLGQESSGCLVFCGLDTSTGEFVTIREWKLVSLSGPTGKTLQWADNVGQEVSGKLLKQVTSVEQEIISLISKISHPHLVQYLAVKVTSIHHFVAVQVLEEYVGGGNLEIQLRPNGIPVELLKLYMGQILEALRYLHGKSVVHKDLKLSNCCLDSSGNIKLSGYSVGKRLADLHVDFGADKSSCAQTQVLSTRLGKKGDIYDMGLIVLSLLKGEIVTAAEAEIPRSAPDNLQDFISHCLSSSEKERLSAYQLLQLPFLLPDSLQSYDNFDTSERLSVTSGVSVPDASEPQAPIPEFTFFSGVPGKSRIKTEFEQLEFLGKGGFGNVIKVRNKLDGGLYAIKRIPWNPKNTNLNRKIAREVQLISRLNHENVVRYYNSWLEVADENDVPSESEESLSDQVDKKLSLVEPQNGEDLLLELNKFEAPSAGQVDNEQDDSWCSDHDEKNKHSDSESSEGECSSNPGQTSPPRGSFYSSKSGGSSEGIVFATNSIDESLLQFGDLLDTESEDDDDDGQAWEIGTSTESNDDVSLQYLYMQMEYCEKRTLRYLMDEGLNQDRDKVWRLLREIVEGLAHIHSQGIIHRDLKPVNLFLDAHGHIKIGDFGLATTHGLTRGEPTQDVHTDNVTSAEAAETSTTAEGMTGKVGTVLYVAPELAKGSARLKYSQKVDLYSLGIIFFEMCYRPLSTGMERVTAIGNIRTSKIKFPEDFDKKRMSKEMTVLCWLLQHDPIERPTSQELLQSHFIPPKLEDHQLDEVLKHTLSSTNSTRYRRLMDAMFSQHVNPVFDVTYDIEIFKAGTGARAVLAQQHVHETLKRIFTGHGALCIRTPLLMPRTHILDNLESAVSVVDHSGGLVALPYDLRIPFARYIARSGVTYVKRFDIGCVYRDRKVLGAHPKELYECAFDIVSPTSEGNVSDAEVLLTVAEIIREFPCLDNRKYFIRMNHAGLLKAVLTTYGIPEHRHQDIFTILQESQTERLRNEHLNELFEGLLVSEHSIAALYGFLYCEGTVDKVREHIIGVLKRRTQASTDARQALQELQAVVSHCATFDVKLPIVIKTTFLYNIQHFSGILFQVVATDNRKMKRGGVDILAAGGRYDKLIAHFVHGSTTQHCPGAVGVSIAVEKIVSAVSNDESINLPCACDVLVCSTSHTSMLTERMRIVHELWSAGIHATLMYDSPAQFTLEDMQDYCRETGIPHLVFLKEQDPGVVKVVSNEKDKVTKSLISSKDLLEHLQVKINSRSEAADVAVSNLKSSNTAASTADYSSFACPDIQVSFQIQDKLPWNIKKRYESQILAKIGPVVQQVRLHIGSKSGVEVIGVDLPGNILKSMTASLDLDDNQDIFDKGVSAVTSKHTRYAKAITRLSDELRELKITKKLPIIFVYSVKDEVYRIFL